LIFVLQVTVFFQHEDDMMTLETWSRFVGYALDRLAVERSFSISDHFLMEKFELVPPFWEELNRLARIERLPFVFNGRHYVSVFVGKSPAPHSQPTQITFERRSIAQNPM
jgi:hypothetical protein